MDFSFLKKCLYETKSALKIPSCLFPARRQAGADRYPKINRGFWVFQNQDRIKLHEAIPPFYRLYLC